MMYFNCPDVGYDVTKDEEFARLKNDAVAGDAKAQYALACCDNRGIRVSEDQAEAAKWYARAAEEGNPIPRRRMEALRREAAKAERA